MSIIHKKGYGYLLILTVAVQKQAIICSSDEAELNPGILVADLTWFPIFRRLSTGYGLCFLVLTMNNS
jgi:hypothetical protein